MANGELKLIKTDHAYINYNYIYGGTTYTNIHTFTTGGRLSESIAPAISTTKQPLSSLNPAPITATKVIAKINGCMYEYNENKFYGFFYQGEGYPMYFNEYKHNSVPESHDMYSTTDYWPSFCVKKDGTATVRWFNSADSLRAALPYCKCVIGSVHPLVFNSKCVLNEKVYDNESPSYLIYDPQNPGRTDLRFKAKSGTPMGEARRTLLGHLKGASGMYIMVCADKPMTIKVAANLMQDLGCDYAVAMDGGGPSEMRIKSGYGPAGKVTASGGLSLHTAVCAHLV